MEDTERYSLVKAAMQKEIRSSHWRYVENLTEVGDQDDLTRPNKQKRYTYKYIKSLRREGEV
jgi:hypothetical protein